jgi:hypothetical protein
MIGAKFIGSCAILALGAVLLPPHYKANPDYVRSASARAVLQDIGDANITGDISVAPSARADTAYVSGNAMETRSSFEQGFLTLQRTDYSFRLLTRSHCFELQANCLEIKDKDVRKTVSVKVPL